MQTFRIKYQENTDFFYLSTSMYQMQVCIYNSLLYFGGCAHSEIFCLALGVSSHINTVLQFENYQHTDTYNSQSLKFYFTRFNRTLQWGDTLSVHGLYSSTEIQIVCTSSLIYPSFHHISIMPLSNGSFTTESAC